jgi:hypothetical protein
MAGVNKPISDFSRVKFIVKFGKRELTGSDPVLLAFIKKAMEEKENVQSKHTIGPDG